MKEEYKASNHYIRKMEDYKLNKLMGRIRKKAGGPNPLSCKKKKKFYTERRNAQSANNNISE